MSKKRNTKDFALIYCPFCERPAAQADEEKQSGFSRAHARGKVAQFGNRLHVTCGECGKTWLCAQLRFQGWRPGQELGASGRAEGRPEGPQPAQRKLKEESEAADGAGDVV